MPGEPLYLPSDQILQRLSKLFFTPAHDRSVYVVYGPYERLRPFQKRVESEVSRGSFHNEMGKVDYISLARDLFGHLRIDLLAVVADRHRDPVRLAPASALEATFGSKRTYRV